MPPLPHQPAAARAPPARPPHSRQGSAAATMPGSPKVFSSSTAATSRRSSLRRLLSSPAVSASCLLFDLAAAVSVAWDRRPGNAAGGATELPVGHATGSRGRHKVMAFVGIFTGFGSVVRWPSGRGSPPIDRASFG
ncbi:hypothetical protein ZWY2020_005508 [Hordeum vulgare]|nr:hypothetical protein ZWY2020_005508 [Hordeum vulgare]